MKVTYIYHSGYVVQTEGKAFLFDYYKGEIPKFDTEDKIYVMVSHKHADHFNKEIFNLSREYPHVTYILSKDCKMNEKYMDRCNVEVRARNNIHYVTRNERYDFEDVVIETLDSTDCGVAYILYVGGKAIYHAGDLNCWSEELRKPYERIIDTIKGKTFDVAFVPLDGRLGTICCDGIRYFMENTNTRRIFPMHMWENYGLAQTVTEYGERFVPIEYEGQQWEI